MASVIETLCDVCEQPILAGPEVRLENHFYGLTSLPVGGYVMLHMHGRCWDAIRSQFLSERRRDDEAASRRAKMRREQECEAKGKPWPVRFVLDLLDWLARR